MVTLLRPYLLEMPAFLEAEVLPMFIAIPELIQQRKRWIGVYKTSIQFNTLKC